MRLPNILTLIRLFLVPLYVIVFENEEGIRWWSAAIFVLASATDVLDGYLARKLNASTKWGQLMDPLADKCMQLAVLFTLFRADIIPIWFLILLMAKEILMILAGAFLYSKKTYVKANIFGKMNTVILFLVMMLLLLIPAVPEGIKTCMLLVSALFATGAAIAYLYRYFVQDKQFKNYTKGQKKGETL